METLLLIALISAVIGLVISAAIFYIVAVNKKFEVILPFVSGNSLQA